MPQRPQKAYRTLFLIKAFLLFLGIFLLSGCANLSDPETTQIYHGDIVGIVDQSHTLEQTIQTRQSRIDGMYLWIQSDPASEPQTGKITFDLYNPPDASSPWASSAIKAGTYRSDQSLYITFQPKEKALSNTYKLVIRTTNGAIQVFGRSEDNYSRGTAVQDSTPLPGDIAFRVNYQYDIQTLWGDFVSTLPQFGLAVIVFLFFFIPGNFLLSSLKINQYFAPAERIGLSVALSMALPVCIMEWTSVFNYRWTQGAVWFVYAGIAILYSWWAGKVVLDYLRKIRSSQKPSNELALRIVNWPGNNRYLIALVVIFLFSLAIRLIMVRDLAAPPWVDSVHHALLTRIIMEQGKFPDTYSPYIMANNARYHPGYHVMLAVFQWLSGLELQTGMLLFGQILNAAIVFSVFLFTMSLTQNSKTGLIAALIAGVFTPMPAYYTSWGRYTQLAGLLIMPAAFALIKFSLSREFAEIRNKNKRMSVFLLAGILCAGLFITHYRVIVFLGLLLIAFLIVRYLSKIKNRTLLKLINNDFSLVFFIIAISILFSAPWLPGTLAEFILPKIESSLKGDTAFAGHSWAYLTSGLGAWTLYLALAGILMGVFKRKKFTWVLIIWVIFLFIMANLNMLKLPMSGFINNTSVEIALFLPIAVLGGYLSVFIINLIGGLFHGKWVLVYNGVVLIAVIICSVFGAQKLLPILNPDTVLARQADIPAIHWIENNIPAEETIFINPLAWGYGLYTGADGGFWITPLSGRKTMPPPLLYGFDTQGDISRYVTQLSKDASEKSNDPIALYNLLISENIHYVYLGAKGGIVSPQRLIESKLFNPIYNKDGVWIFALAR